MNLLALGQTLLALGRPQDAAARLREGLDAATQLGNDSLLRAMRQSAEAAARAVKMHAMLERPLDEVLAEAGSDEAQANVLLTRRMALTPVAPDEAAVLADRAIELAQQCGTKRLEIGAYHAKSMAAAKQNRLEEAQALLQQALSMAEAEGLSEIATNLAKTIEALDEGV